MRTKIYTKGGDSGQTSTIGGPRVSKADPRLEVYGTIDELNACLGVSLSQLKSHYFENKGDKRLLEVLEKTQNELFNVGSQLACSDETMRTKLPPLKEDGIFELETEIDKMTEQIPELREFI